MRILITGSTGFVGKVLVKMLEESGHEIIHLVRTKKGLKNEILWDFKSALPEEVPQCNAVIHLAAHVDFGLNINIMQYNVNTVSTIRLSDYARHQNAYFVLASMIGIHGYKHERFSGDTPIDPEDHYSMSKYLAEEVVRTYIDNYSILRICGIYGLDGPGHLGLNNAISNAIHKNEAPVLKGPGKAKRNYICVLDVARWILYLLDHFNTASTSGKEKTQEVLYLASPEILTIEDYLQAIGDIILPDMDITRIKGSESRDYIVNESPAPFNLIKFREYLKDILVREKGHA